MNIFGHHVERRVIALAVLDGLLFFASFALLTGQLDCAACGLIERLSLEPYKAIAMAALLLLISIALGLYNGDAAYSSRVFLQRFLVNWEVIAAAAMLFIVLSGALPTSWLSWTALLVISGIALMMVAQLGIHIGLDWWLSRPSMKRRVLVLGDGPAAEGVRAFLTGAARQRFEHVQTIASWGGVDLPPTQVGNVLLASESVTTPSLADTAQALRCGEIVVAAEDTESLPVEDLLECKLRGVAVIEALDFWEREAGLIDVRKAHTHWFALSTGFLLGPRRRRVKRLADVMISAAFLLLALPVGLLVALAIRLDSPGPIFYRQERVGLNGGIFRVWKFRSMHTDAERDGAPRWAATGDNRVTRVGRIIRLARIDEIPQVLNVLAGEMSFIGPRPERPYFVDQLREVIPHYDVRHRVCPGITGWAQVNYPYGASVEDARRKLAYDLYYVKRNDLLLDFVILLQTIRVVLFAHGGR